MVRDFLWQRGENMRLLADLPPLLKKWPEAKQ
jgi:hypothetical protein